MGFDGLYPDHQGSGNRTIRSSLGDQARDLKAELVVTTEKDGGKVAPLLSPADGSWWAVRLGTEITSGEDRLRQLVVRQSMRTPVEVCA